MHFTASYRKLEKKQIHSHKEYANNLKSVLQLTSIAVETPQGRHELDSAFGAAKPSPGVKGRMEATGSLVLELRLTSRWRRTASVPLTVTIPTSEPTGRSWMANLRTAERRKPQDSC